MTAKAAAKADHKGTETQNPARKLGRLPSPGEEWVRLNNGERFRVHTVSRLRNEGKGEVMFRESKHPRPAVQSATITNFAAGWGPVNQRPPKALELKTAEELGRTVRTGEHWVEIASGDVAETQAWGEFVPYTLRGGGVGPEDFTIKRDRFMAEFRPRDQRTAEEIEEDEARKTAAAREAAPPRCPTCGHRI